eukprot:10775093-Ditylum_brightwellii.AAC.1
MRELRLRTVACTLSATLDTLSLRLLACMHEPGSYVTPHVMLLASSSALRVHLAPRPVRLGLRG